MNLTQKQMNYIDKIVSFMKSEKDLEDTITLNILSNSSKVKLLNILAHVFNIISNTDNICIRVIDGNFKICMYSAQTSDEDQSDTKIYHNINIDEIWNAIICNDSYVDIYKILYINFN